MILGFSRPPDRRASHRLPPHRAGTNKLVKTLGIDSPSKSQASPMAADLDEHVDQFRHRPLGDAGLLTFVTADALAMTSAERARNQRGRAAVVTGVNADGRREVLGMRIATAD